MDQRPKRFLAEKACYRCGESKRAEEFPKVRGGGTSDICNVCKRKAVSEAMKQHHAREVQTALEAQQAFFDEQLRKDQARWDSLPDGHPYKAPKRPGSTS